jgi:hypothetical protein
MSLNFLELEKNNLSCIVAQTNNLIKKTKRGNRSFIVAVFTIFPLSHIVAIDLLALWIETVKLLSFPYQKKKKTWTTEVIRAFFFA